MYGKSACPVLWGTGARPKVWLRYCGTAGKPGGKRRKQTSACSHGSPRSTRLLFTWGYGDITNSVHIWIFSIYQNLCQTWDTESDISGSLNLSELRISQSFKLLKFLTSGRIKLSKMRLVVRLAYEPISYFVKVKTYAYSNDPCNLSTSELKSMVDWDISDKTTFNHLMREEKWQMIIR